MKSDLHFQYKIIPLNNNNDLWDLFNQIEFNLSNFIIRISITILWVSILEKQCFFFNKRGITFKNSWFSCEMPYLFNLSKVIEFYFPNLKFFNANIFSNLMM